MVNEDKANLQSKVFFVWGSFCFVCIAFVYFLIYETKGLTLEEVDELYARVSKAWESQNFIPEISFQDIKVGHNGERGESIAQAVERKTSVSHIDG